MEKIIVLKYGTSWSYKEKQIERGGKTLFEKRGFKGNQHNKTSSSNVVETPSTLSTNTTDDIPSCSLNNSGDIDNTSTLSASARKLTVT